MALIKHRGSTQSGMFGYENTAYDRIDDSMPSPEMTFDGQRRSTPEEIMSMIRRTDGVMINSQYDIRFDGNNNFQNIINRMQSHSKTSEGEITKLLSQFCVNVSAPYGQVQTSEIRHFGELFSMPADRGYGEPQLTFYMDNKGIIYEFFDTWINMVYDRTQRTVGWYNEYAVDFFVFLTKKLYYSTNNAGDHHGIVNPMSIPVIKIKYESAYPLSLNLSSMSGTDGRSPLQFDVMLKARRTISQNVLNSTSDWTPTSTIRNPKIEIDEEPEDD